MNKNTMGLISILAAVIIVTLIQFDKFSAKKEAACLVMGVTLGAVAQWCMNTPTPKDDQ